MALTEVVSREQWEKARREFLVKEREFTRARDALSAERRKLPRVLISKDYALEGPKGKVGLLDLFEGRRQLVVYHFMYPDDDAEWCRSCSFWIDNVGDLSHMNARDTSFAVTCPAPWPKTALFIERMGWNVPWYSTAGTSFYEDFYMAFEEELAPESPGVSAFIREGDEIYHTYSTHRRGSDILNGTYNYLDLTALGRQEDALEFTQAWVQYHDEYTA